MSRGINTPPCDKPWQETPLLIYSIMRSQQFLCGCVVLLCLTTSCQAIERRELSEGGHYILDLPPRINRREAYPVAILLHGAGDRAENFVRVWRRLSPSGHGLIVAAPEASTQLGNGYNWSTATAIPRIQETVDDLVAHYSADRKRLMLFGLSAGCGLGFQVIAEKPETFRCFAGVAYGVFPGLVAENKLAAAAKSTRVYFAIGKKDPGHALFQPTVELLERYNFHFKAEEPSGVGHTISRRMHRNLHAFFKDACEDLSRNKATGIP